MKISFLLDHAYGVGGAIRATISTANALAEIGHEVTIMSVQRLRDEPSFEVDGRVRLQPIVDLRNPKALSESDAKLHERPPKVLPRSEAVYKAYSQLLETRVAQALADTDAQVLIGTRMGLNTYLARFAPTDRVRVGMAHTTFNYYNAPSLVDETKALSKLDALITVAAGDVPVWRNHLAGSRTQVAGIANCVAPSGLAPADLDSKTIMAVGRLVGVKQFHLLIRAFAIVASKYPDWKLRIYGRGAARDGLRDLIFTLGLHNQVFLMGAVTPIEPEWAKASVAAVTSRLESFHIGMVEAQQLGVPVVSMACEQGPLDIITPDSDGILTPVNDIEAFADGLLRVINDMEFGKRLGRQGMRTATRFYPEAVARQYHKFLTRLHRRKSGASRLRFGGAALPRRTAVKPAGPARTVDCFVPSDTGILEIHTGDKKLKELVLSQQGKTKTLKLPCSGGIARVPVTTALVEGTYDVKLPGPEGERRALAGSLDLRGLLNRTDLTGHRLSHIVPFRDAGGYLVLRSWRRTVHAEAGDLIIAEDGITVTGRLYGKYSSDSRLHGLAVCRQDAERSTTVEARLSPNGDFAFTVPTEDLAHPGKVEDLQLWDLSVKLTNDTEPIPKPVRVTRVLDDLAARKAVFVYPALRCQDRFGSEITPYFTDHNGLSIRVKPTLPVLRVPNLCGHQ